MKGDRGGGAAASRGVREHEGSSEGSSDVPPAAPQSLSESADAASDRHGGKRVVRTSASKAPSSYALAKNKDDPKKSAASSASSGNGPPTKKGRFDDEGDGDGNDDDDSGGREGGEPAERSAATDDPPPSVVPWYIATYRKANNARIMCGRFVNDDRVQLFVIFLIAINAIMMGIGTFDFVTDDPAIEDAFETVDQAFLIVFSVELGLQFVYHGLRLFLDGWLLFDFVVIVLSWAFAQAQIVRAFRIFRALRLVTRVTVMRNLVKALFAVMPNMAAIAMLLALVMYIFSVMFTQLFKSTYEEGHTEYDYFSRLDRTFFTLFQIMTFDAWADPAREVMTVYSWAWVLFIVFVVISGFIFVNLIVAVICDAIAALHEDEKALLHGHGGGINVDDEDDSELYEELEEERQRSGRVGGEREGEGGVARRRSSVGEGLKNQPSARSVRSRGSQLNRQIKTLEVQIEKTKRMQERTAMTIEYLTQHLQSLPSERKGGKKGKEKEEKTIEALSFFL